MPPLRWAQTADAIHVTVALRDLALGAPPVLRGAELVLDCRGGLAGGGATQRFSTTLHLFAPPLALDEGDVSVGGSELRLTLRKRPPPAAEGAAAAAWPRLLHDAALDLALRRLRRLEPDWRLVDEAYEAEEREVAEAERMRKNVVWLEEKWARQGRGTLADVIGGAPALDDEQLRRMAGEMAEGGGGGGGGGGATLTAEQQTMLEAGTHPSQIPGLEGGYEIEVDAAMAQRLKKEL